MIPKTRPGGTAPGDRRTFRALLADSAIEHRGFAFLVALYFAGAAGVGAGLDHSVIDAVALYVASYLTFLPASIAVLLAGRILQLVVTQRPRHPLKALIADLRVNLLTPVRLANALPVLVLMPLLGGTFTFFKATIGIAMPFSWDAAFADWDAALHAGYAPWALLQPLLGAPPVTFGINLLYNLWLFALSVFWVWQAFSLADRQLRLQFFYTFALAWIVLGTGLAITLASAGPCYFADTVGDPDPFAPLLAYLEHANEQYAIWALDVQALLWRYHETGELSFGAGISAMPSMHVAMAFLFYLVGRRANRWLGRICLIYLAVILLGSVHLAWHYAIDGYVALVAVLPIWWLAGRLATGARRRPAPESTSVARR